jgi:hypothetical protein
VHESHPYITWPWTSRRRRPPCALGARRRPRTRSWPQPSATCPRPEAAASTRESDVPSEGLVVRGQSGGGSARAPPVAPPVDWLTSGARALGGRWRRSLQHRSRACGMGARGRVHLCDPSDGDDGERMGERSAKGGGAKCAADEPAEQRNPRGEVLCGAEEQPGRRHSNVGLSGTALLRRGLSSLGFRWRWRTPNRSM